MSFLNELIDGSGAVSNACQSWHLWGMPVDFLVTWLKKKNGSQYNYYEYLAIFLSNSIVTGMPYLPAKDELVSLNRLSSKGFWKWYNSKVFDRRLYGVEQHFTFCRFSRKRIFFGNFDCDFRKWVFFWLNMEDFGISVLTENSRYLHFRVQCWWQVCKFSIAADRRFLTALEQCQ